MAEYDEREVKTSHSGVDADGTVVQERTRSVKSSADASITLVNIVWYIYGVIATLLVLRFILKLSGANPANGFVDFIYAVSKIFSVPFDTIFGVTTAQAGMVTSVFEPSILVALVIYALVAWGISRLFTLNEPQ